jgi:hypothetical protein
MTRIAADGRAAGMRRYNNTLRYRVLIVLVWLTVPVAALWLLRSDYERYQLESQRQLEYCRARSDHLLYFTNMMGKQAEEIRRMYQPEDRPKWEREWRDLEAQENQAAVRLGTVSLNLLPLSEQVLSHAQSELIAMKSHIETAAQRKDAFNKAGSGLDDVQERIFGLQGQAEWYRRVGALGIYLELQEAIARYEETLDRQLSARRQLDMEAGKALAEADNLQRSIQRELGHLPDKITEDRKQTYREQLARRMRSFDPRRELRELIMGSATAATPAGQPGL